MIIMIIIIIICSRKSPQASTPWCASADLLAEVEEELAPGQVRHDEEELVLGLEAELQPHDKREIDLGHDVPLRPATPTHVSAVLAASTRDPTGIHLM
jgi:hypothetical protein